MLVMRCTEPELEGFCVADLETALPCRQIYPASKAPRSCAVADLRRAPKQRFRCPALQASRVKLLEPWQGPLSRLDKLKASLAARLPASWPPARRDAFLVGIGTVVTAAWIGANPLKGVAAAPQAPSEMDAPLASDVRLSRLLIRSDVHAAKVCCAGSPHVLRERIQSVIEVALVIIGRWWSLQHEADGGVRHGRRLHEGVCYLLSVQRVRSTGREFERRLCAEVA